MSGFPGVEAAGWPVEGDVKNESELRRAIRSVFGKSVTWVEPGRGGTVGCADCLLPVRDRRGGLPGAILVGVELKDGERDGGSIRFDMRPAQRNWHRARMADGVATCVLIRDGEDVLGLPGFLYPMTQQEASFSGLKRLEHSVPFANAGARKRWDSFIWSVAVESMTGNGLPV